MITRIILPKDDANMTEATVAQWLKQEGEPVKKGEPLVEIVTDKAVFELEAPRTGILRKIIAPPQSVLPPGYILGLLGPADEKLPAYEKHNQQLLDAFTRDQIASPTPLCAHASTSGRSEPTATGNQGKKVRATPAARRLARQHNLSLEEIKQHCKAAVINEKTVNEYLEKQK